MKKIINSVISSILCFCLILGVLPIIAINASASGYEMLRYRENWGSGWSDWTACSSSYDVFGRFSTSTSGYSLWIDNYTGATADIDLGGSHPAFGISNNTALIMTSSSGGVFNVWSSNDKNLFILSGNATIYIGKNVTAEKNDNCSVVAAEDGSNNRVFVAGTIENNNCAGVWTDSNVSLYCIGTNYSCQVSSGSGTNKYYSELTLNRSTGINDVIYPSSYLYEALTYEGKYYYENNSSIIPSCTLANGYKFTSWTGSLFNASQSPSISISSSISITANASPISYSVVYSPGAGSGSPVTETHQYTTTYTTKSADLFTRTGYDFAYWSGSNGEIYGADESISGLTVQNGATVTLTAVWLPRAYVIEFLNYDGSLLQKTSFNYNTMPVYSADSPVKPSDAQYTYNWAGWDNPIAAVSGEATYTAVFTNELNKYSVVFKDGDGNVLQSGLWDYGAMPVYDIASSGTPQKSATAEYSYTWNNTWSSEILAVTGDAEYIACFESTKNEYTVTFKGYNGKILQSGKWEYGTLPVYDIDTNGTPVRAFDDTSHYVFEGEWNVEIATVTGDAEYVAVLTPTEHSFTNYVYNNDRSCDTDGTMTAVCDGCVKTNTLVDPAHPSYGGVHVFENYVPQNNATCVLAETEIAVCSRCNIATDERSIPGSSLGHEFLDENYTSNDDALCLEDGTETAKCTRCDVTDTRTDVGSALRHTYGDYVYNDDATCTLNGTETATCIRCDAGLTREVEGSSLGHSFCDWYYTVNPDCTNTGSMHRVCSRCYIFEDKTAPALGHRYINTVVLPTCTGRGFTVHTCAVCAEKYNDSFVEPHGHTYEPWYTVKEASCTSDGREARKCSVCSRLEFRDVDSHHTPSAEDPNVCAVCGIVINPVEKPSVPEPVTDSVYCCEKHHYPNNFWGKILAFFCKIRQIFAY